MRLTRSLHCPRGSAQGDSRQASYVFAKFVAAGFPALTLALESATCPSPRIPLPSPTVPAGAAAAVFAFVPAGHMETASQRPRPPALLAAEPNRATPPGDRRLPHQGGQPLLGGCDRTAGSPGAALLP